MANAPIRLVTSHRRIVDLYNNGAVLCAFDTETTGINPLHCCVIEIGAVKFNKNGIIDRFSTLIKPYYEIPEEITKLTGISPDMVCSCPTAGTIIPQFREFCKDTILLAHNAQFDVRFIDMECERLGYRPLLNPVIDTLRMSRILLPDNTSWKQTSLASQFNIDTGHAHRASDDANVCMQLFQRFVTMEVPKKKKTQPKQPGLFE
ncbi:MAG: 3'-5' exonuclease [Treponema sp.]|nr:3'-5' exonuclease [Treponema sp.]